MGKGVLKKLSGYIVASSLLIVVHSFEFEHRTTRTALELPYSTKYYIPTHESGVLEPVKYYYYPVVNQDNPTTQKKVIPTPKSLRRRNPSSMKSTLQRRAEGEGGGGEGGTKTLPRTPGLPNDIPLPSINLTNLIQVVQLADNNPDLSNLNDQQQASVIQALSQIASFIGLQDIRDLLGMTMMSFVLGPIALQLFWLPITLFIMGALMIPLVINGNNVVLANAGRGLGLGDDGESYCLEMIDCEVNNFLRGSPLSTWASRMFNITSVEWAPSYNETLALDSRSSSENTYFLDQDNCSKYTCRTLVPVQRLFGAWYSYVFTFRQKSYRRRKKKRT